MSNFTPRLRSVAFLFALSAVALLAPVNSDAQKVPAPRGGRPKTERFKGREVVAGEVIVKFSKSAAPEAVAHAKAAADVEADKAVGGRGARLFKSRTKSVEALVRELSARGDVVYAEPNYVVRLSAVPNDPSFGEQWALRNTGYSAAGPGTPGADIGVVAAWDVSTGSRDNVVAVVDTGVDYRHPDLAANMWSAPAPFTVNIAGQTIQCAAGSHGFDALTNTCDPADDHNHGTHVAGTVGAVGNNGIGVSGVSQTASIMALRFLDAQGNGTLEGAINAIEFAIQAKQAFGAGANVRVLSNSWGWNGDASQALLDQINRAAASDMLFVAGAGNTATDNDVSPFYPASNDAPSVVSVAATDSHDRLALTDYWGSNYGLNSVDLAAPGNLVLSTVVGGSYDWFSGTSMATPHVSGAAALLLSRCALDTAGLKDALLDNVDPVAALSGYTATGGRLNVDKAMRSCAAPPNQPPAVALTGPAGGDSFTIPASINITASASDADGTISRVDFYAGSQLVGAADASPYTFTWHNVAEGTYSLTAVATDDDGDVTTSPVVSITVNRTPEYMISGTVLNGSSGLGGVTLTLKSTAAGFAPRTATTSSTGAYSFGSVPAGGSYVVGASSAAYNFTPASRSYSNLSANQSSQNFSVSSRKTYSISGRAVLAGTTTGLGGVSLRLVNSETGAAVLGATTASNGSYTLAGVPAGVNYTLRASKAGYDFAPTSRSINNLTSNQAAQDFAASTVYSISGAVLKGSAGLGGVTLTVQSTTAGFTPRTVVTSSTGAYTFTSLPSGRAYYVVPSSPVYIFTPASRSYGASVKTNQMNQNYSVSARRTYNITGRVTQAGSGAGLGGVTVKLVNAATGALAKSVATAADGTYSLSGVQAGFDYTLTPSKSGSTFSPASRSYTNLAASQSGQDFNSP